MTQWGRKQGPAVLTLAGVLLVFGILSFLSLLLDLTGSQSTAALAGRFLMQGFSWAAFFVPLYFFLAVAFLLSPGFRPRTALILTLLILPFLTASLLLHVLQGSTLLLPSLLLSAFGELFSAFLLFLLLLLEILFLVTLPGGRKGSGGGRRQEIASYARPLLLPSFKGDTTPPDVPSAAQLARELEEIGPSVSGRPEPAPVAPPSPPASPEISEEPRAHSDDPAPVETETQMAPAPAEADARTLKDALEPMEPEASESSDVSEPAEADAPESLEAPEPAEAGIEEPLEISDAAEAEEPSEDPEPEPSEPSEPTESPQAACKAPQVDPAPLAADRAPQASDKAPQGELPFGQVAGVRVPYGIPVGEVLKNRGGEEYWVIDPETRRAAQILTAALQEFNIQAEVTGIRKGPVITLFEVLPAQGVRISKIANLSDNIALRLAAPSVRIVAPIPGRHAVGIEVPNRKRAIVSFREMVSLDVMQKSGYEIPLVLGKDILGEAQIIDLVQTPHLLIGGATNSGKSVLVNAVICSILFRRSPDEVRLFLIDPKIVELKQYNGVPHLLTPVITEPKKAFQALQYCIAEMERRYVLLDALAVRDIRAYNKKAKKERVQRLPYIVIVIDQFADLMATTGKELESTLARLAAMARAVGIHMVLATQRPSIDVITGLIKANIPSRIAFMVANKFDSRIIVDCVGAEKLLGKGDMLFSAAWNPFPVRIQGAFVDDEEIEAITEYVKKLGPPQYIEDEVFFDDEETGDFQGEPGNDPLYERALEVVVAQGKASASYLQRRLKVGYNRAARLVEEMETRGIVGPAQGSKPRDLLHIPKT